MKADEKRQKLKQASLKHLPEFCSLFKLHVTDYRTFFKPCFQKTVCPLIFPSLFLYIPKCMNKKINLDDTVFNITEACPQIIPYLVQKGFAPLANPFMRKLMGRKISLRKALMLKKLDIQTCEAELNALIEAAHLPE